MAENKKEKPTIIYNIYIPLPDEQEKQEKKTKIDKLKDKLKSEKNKKSETNLRLVY